MVPCRRFEYGHHLGPGHDHADDLAMASFELREVEPQKAVQRRLGFRGQIFPSQAGHVLVVMAWLCVCSW